MLIAIDIAEIDLIFQISSPIIIAAILLVFDRFCLCSHQMAHFQMKTYYAYPHTAMSGASARNALPGTLIFVII